MPFDPANLTTLAARHQRLMQIRYGHESHGLTTEQKLQKILHYCAVELDVARAGLWRLNSAGDAITCIMQYERGAHHFSCGAEFHASDYPRYFAAIRNDRIIKADDARTDNRTAEFLESYLKPLNIYSLLDCPTFAGGKLAGVLCIESEDRIRNWSLLDISFAAAAADAVSAIQEQHLWEEERRYNQFLEQYDRLTGLANRRSFQQQVFRDISARPEERHLLVLLGLDAFTAINDKFGHVVANSVLRVLGERATEITRRFGSASGRVSGDVLGFWLSPLPEQPVVEDFLRAVREIIDEAIATEYGVEVPVTGTIGVYFHTAEQKAVPDPILAAEIALKNAKQVNRGGVGVFSEHGYQQLQDKTRMVDEIHHALEQRQFVLWYQPVFDARRNLYTGVEALIRWQHPRLGLLSPGRFMPLVAEIGKSRELGAFVFAQTCENAALLLADGLDVGRVSVNLAAEQLYNNNLALEIQRLLKQYSLPGQLLEVEILEELIGHDFDLVNTQLTNLRDIGIGISVDDFGTGYSSLSRLKLLPVQKIKIDKSFVDGLPHSANDQSIVRSIVALARALQLELVAEGVETPEQSDWLKKEGVDYLQGFLYSRPLDIVQLREFLRRRVLV
jgi:diguanylate cyclase (GGDEF)-like protein